MSPLEELEARVRVLEDDRLKRDTLAKADEESSKKRSNRLDIVLKVLGLGGLFAGALQILRIAARWLVQHSN